MFYKDIVRVGIRRGKNKFRAESLVCCLFIFALLSSAGEAEDFDCTDNSLLQITAPDNQMVSDICYAAAKAIAFLARYELHLQRPIRIEIIETSINSHGYGAYGSFDRQKEIIQLMSYSAVLNTGQSPQMYGEPFDIEHYHGAVAHEITHAVFHQNTGKIKDQLTSASQEYLAHSTQLATLPFERRRKIIAANNVGPWESGDSISDVYMGLNPTGFAVKSYLHLTHLENPQHFITLLLNHNWFYISVP